MDRRSAEIQSRGAEYFEQIVADKEEETLHLEFKTISHDGGRLTRVDKDTIGRAVGGMANAEGGVLILGIETETSDGIDRAAAKRAIKTLRRTTNLVRAYISDVLSPQHTGIEVFCIDEQGKTDEGFIVIDVPQSFDRPHYSNSHHQYFRRGWDRTRVLEHSEIRELMFAVREGKIEVKVSAAAGQVSRAPRQVRGLIQLSIRNVGLVPVTAPYLKVYSAEWQLAPEAPSSLRRRLSPHTIGIYTLDIVHIDDEVPLAMRPYHIYFKEDVDVALAIREIQESRDETSFRIRAGDDGPTDVDILFGPFEVTFGAANVAPRTVKCDFSKWEMFEMIAKIVLDEDRVRAAHSSR
jgi:hypothetical protein